MSLLKSFLTSENVEILSFNVSTLYLAVLVVFILIILTLKFKKKEIRNKLLSICLLTISITALLAAFLYTITGEYLFAKPNDKYNAMIATVALLGYIMDRLKNLFKE